MLRYLNTMGRSAVMPFGLAALVLTAAAPPQPDSARERAPIPLVVRNDNFLDVHVYAVRGGTFWSVGFVPSFSQDTFELRESLVAPGDDFRLFADPVGGMGGYLSEPILAGPNDTIVFHVKESLNLSNVSTRSS